MLVGHKSNLANALYLRSKYKTEEGGRDLKIV